MYLGESAINKQYELQLKTASFQFCQTDLLLTVNQLLSCSLKLVDCCNSSSHSENKCVLKINGDNQYWVVASYKNIGPLR